jgi:hypothetical protein
MWLKSDQTVSRLGQAYGIQPLEHYTLANLVGKQFNHWLIQLSRVFPLVLNK